MNNLVGIIIALVIMLPGLAGVILPGLPGIPYMFLVATIYGLLTGFTNLSLSDFWWLGTIAALSVLIDYLAGMLGAKFAGAGKKALILGAIGLALGTLLLPPFGGIVFMFIGILLAELWIYGRGHEQAVRSATGSVVGSVAGTILNLVLGLGFILLFAILVSQ